MVIDRHIRCIRIVNNNRYMYRKTSSTYAHSYKILLFDSQNLAFSQKHAHTAHKTEPTHSIAARHFVFALYTGFIAYIQRRTPCITLHYRERRKHFIIPLICVYNNRVGNGFTPATDTICRLTEEAIDHKRESSNLQLLSQE